MKNNLSEMPVYAPITPNEPMEAIGHRIQRFVITRADHPALISEQGTVSWRALLDQTNQIANRLRDAGLQHGDSVAALSENSADYVALYLGVLTAGGCMVPLSEMTSAEALSLMLSDCAAQFLFVSQKNRDLLHRFRAGLQELSDDRIVALDNDSEGIGQALRDWLGDASAEARPADVSLDDAFNIIYSSGTSAPLRPDVIADAMARWPGDIREVYGLTEGGISTSLDCAAHPDKWSSVGIPTEGAEVRVIDEDGRELPKGEIDEDGFIYILDRRKDMIISGGFNIYAVDLEQALLTHPAVDDAAVIGIPSKQWGETPLGLVVLKPGHQDSGPAILEWTNGQLGKGQRISAIELREELPRSTIGKVLKRELREPYWQKISR